MDAMTYATITEVCARLAGRLSDGVLGAVRGYYAAGEWAIGDDTLLLNLAYQGVGITQEEHDLIRTLLDESNVADLAEVLIVAEVPPLAYHFRSMHPADAPDPTRADRLLGGHAARNSVRRIHRAWRDPLNGAPDGATWVFVVHVAEGIDELKTFSGLSAVLWTDLKEKWPMEVIAEGAELTAYQAAALAAAQLIWTV
jgi:hypothetical protein